MGEFPNKETQFKPGVSGNPAGPPKGTKHLSTWINELLNDEEFDTYIQHPTKGWKEYKGAPIKAIIEVAIRKALGGDDRAMEWLAKHGYGSRQILEVNDKRKDILKGYGLAGQAEEAESGSSEDSA